jgi:hypothetical protein
MATAKKKATKKVAKKTAKRFTMTAKVNGEDFIVKTNDPVESLLELRPDLIKDKTIVSLTEGKNVVEKVINVPKARLVFNNKLATESFINSLRISLYE